MSRMLFMLSAASGTSGAGAVIISVLLKSGTLLLNAGLIALLMSALLAIAAVLTAHWRRKGHPTG